MELHQLVTRFAEVIDGGEMPGMQCHDIFLSEDGQAMAFFANHLVEPHRVLYLFYGIPNQVGDRIIYEMSFRLFVGEVRAGYDMTTFLRENYESSCGYQGMLGVCYHEDRPILVYTHPFRVYPEMGHQIALIEMATRTADIFLPPMLESTLPLPLEVAFEEMIKIGIQVQ